LIIGYVASPQTYSGAGWAAIGVVAVAVLGALVFPLVAREVWAWLRRRRRR
jgi:hypothetical protein